MALDALAILIAYLLSDYLYVLAFGGSLGNEYLIAATAVAALFVSLGKVRQFYKPTKLLGPWRADQQHAFYLGCRSTFFRRGNFWIEN